MTPFATLPVTPAEAFRLRFFGAALHLRERTQGDAFPFLADYCREADAAGLRSAAAWDAAVTAWEAGADVPLPRLLAAAGLATPYPLVLAGIADEDARFGALFDAFTGRPRPTAGLIHSWWPAWRSSLRRLQALGLVEVADAGAPRADAPLVAAATVWDALRGEAPGATSGLRHLPSSELEPLDELILPEATRAALTRAPQVLAVGAAGALVVRGPPASGRRTALHGVARALGRGVLETAHPAPPAFGALAVLLDALPVLIVDAAPGETREVPVPDPADALGVVAGRSGGLTGPGVRDAVTLTLDLPGPDCRARHWRAALGAHAPADELARRYRMTGGNLRRAAGLARAEAALAGRGTPGPEDVAAAVRQLQGHLLETLAARVTTQPHWDNVAVRPQTAVELRLLEARCRHRESLAAAAADAPGAGVRALLTGPSGTGKTLAARTLAGVLGSDLYRIDLASVVNKYLGETEKHLERLFSRAEAAGAILLLDEGDALMTRRTDVQTSNDRYANLETNFLLQRLECFEGTLLITTNAGERIDGAFRRRMDVVIDFAAPDELERAAIWSLHLPGGHAAPDALVAELAVRCAMTGGQIRNAVLHAVLLALEAGDPVGADHVEAAVRREYVKAGRVCPLAREPACG